MKSISIFRIPDNKPDRRYQHKKAAYAVFSESDNPYFDFFHAIDPTAITITAGGLVTISCMAKTETGTGLPSAATYPAAIGNKGTTSNATILIIFIKGLTAGSAVSLYGSPTVSPVTAALCASDPFSPK